jgi:GTPase SAR1 family protein
VDFATKQLRLPQEEGANAAVAVELFLLDCAGQSIFNKLDMNAAHYDNASFVAVVFDVANRESFQSCGRWLQAVRASRTAASTMPGVLIAAKVSVLLEKVTAAARATVGPHEC